MKAERPLWTNSDGSKHYLGTSVQFFLNNLKPMVLTNPYDEKSREHSCVLDVFHLLAADPDQPTSQTLCFLMMYETAAPLEYHRNTTAEQQRCSIMETDGTAPALLTLSTTKIELAWHSRLRQGPRKGRGSLTAAHVCPSLWVPPGPDGWMDGRGTCTGLCWEMEDK